MKVLIAVHHFPPNYTGGAEWRAYRTARAMQARGHEVRVLAVERIDHGPPRAIAYHDEEFQGVAVRRLSYDLSTAPDRSRWEYDNPWIGQHLRDLMRDDRPTVFHLISGYLMTGSALHAAADLGVPSAVSVTDFWFMCPRITLLRSDGSLSPLPVDHRACARCIGEQKRRYRWLAKALPGAMDMYWRGQAAQARVFAARADFLRDALRSARRVISPSRFLRDAYVGFGLDPERVIHARQGFDATLMRDADVTKAPREPGVQLRLVYAGQLAAHKGVHVLIDAVRALPGAPLTLDVYGGASHYPDYAERLRAMSAGDARIRMHPPYQRKDLVDVYRRADIAVVPSLWYENSPNSILEAFALHTPVVATNLGGMAELVQHDCNGLVFALNDARDLARQIQRLLDEPGLVSRLSAGIAPAKTMDAEADEIEAIYRQIAPASEARSVPALG